MKIQQTSLRSPLSRVLCASVCATVLSSGDVRAVQVDTELVLLVDVSGSVSRREYNRLIDGIAYTFESGTVLDSIQEGQMGSIAATLVFWSGFLEQEVAVGWMEISDTVSAGQFAAAIRSATRPFAGLSAVGSAINYATTVIGTETGGSANGFESSQQAVMLITDGTDNSTPPFWNSPQQNLQNATQTAYGSGVDEVSVLVVDNNFIDLENYYQENVLDVGGNPDAEVGVLALNSPAGVRAEMGEGIEGAIGRQQNLTMVPEPSTAAILVLGGAFMLSRRKR